MERVSSLLTSVSKETFWFPVSINGTQYGFKDLEMEPGGNSTIPRLKDFNWSILIGFVLVGVRLLLDKHVLIPLGYKLGVSKKKIIHLDGNPALEAVYKKNTKMDESTYKMLSKQTDMSVRQLEVWFWKRRRKDHPAQIRKFCENSWHLIFYSCAFTYGITVQWHKPWLWSTRECWNGWPRQDVTSDMYWYFMTELAFYWSLIFTLFSDHRRKDYIEFIIHHVVTMLVMYLCWAGNFIRIGSLILVLHDAADPWMAMAKLGVYIKSEWMANGFFLVFVLVWVLSRLIYFPLWIMHSVIYETPEYFAYRGGIINVGLVCLFALLMLHVLWTYSIWKIVYNSIFLGKTRDVRSDTEDAESDENENCISNGAQPVMSYSTHDLVDNSDSSNQVRTCSTNGTSPHKGSRIPVKNTKENGNYTSNGVNRLNYRDIKNKNSPNGDGNLRLQYSSSLRN